jgi:hypothetical protein
LQPGQIKLAQPFADGPIGHLDSETASDLLAQIDATPADNAMFLRIRPLQDRCLQFGHLSGRQQGGLAGTVARSQSRDPLCVVTMHPVAQRLTLHPGSFRSLGPGVPVQNERQGQKAADLRTVTAFRRKRAKIRRRVFGSCDRERLAHSILLRPGNSTGTYRINVKDRFRAPEESGFQTVGLRAAGFAGALHVVSEWATRRRRAESIGVTLPFKLSARTIARLFTGQHDRMSRADVILAGPCRHLRWPVTSSDASMPCCAPGPAQLPMPGSAMPPAACAARSPTAWLRTAALCANGDETPRCGEIRLEGAEGSSVSCP